MNYREQRAYLNCEKRLFDGAGLYGFPEIKGEKVDLTGTEIIGFNYVLGEKHPENKVVHFYLDDYQFERVWSLPERYVELLKQYKAVLSPDFSMYVDFPRVVSMFNHYRKQWCGAYWQEYGINVIPTVGWSDEASFEWCFDGLPKEAMVSVSTIGAWKKPEARELWLKGWSKMLSVLKPETVLLIGKQFPEIKFDGELIVVQSQNLKAIDEKAKRGE